MFKKGLRHQFLHKQMRLRLPLMLTYPSNNKPGGTVAVWALVPGPLDAGFSFIGDFCFTGPVFCVELDGVSSGLGTMCSLRVRTEPSLLCWMRMRSATASSISPMEKKPWLWMRRGWPKQRRKLHSRSDNLRGPWERSYFIIQTGQYFA